MTTSRFPVDAMGLTMDNRDALLEAFAADLARAAYGVVLRTGTRGTWLDLELDLWRALAEKVKAWGQKTAAAPLIGDAARMVQQGNSHD
jgi:hypothetical protein